MLVSYKHPIGGFDSPALYGSVAEWLIASVLKTDVTVKSGTEGSNPFTSALWITSTIATVFTHLQGPSRFVA